MQGWLSSICDALLMHATESVCRPLIGLLPQETPIMIITRYGLGLSSLLASLVILLQ